MGLYVKENNQLKPLAGVTMDENIKAYIRDQNVLSDPESYTVPTTNKTVEYDGFIYGFSNTYSSQHNVDFYVNDVNVTNGLTLQYASAVVAYPLKKGDTIRCTTTTGIMTWTVRFYKLRDYSDRS